MKSIVLPGQVTKVICETCQKRVTATYSYGEFRLDDGLVVEDVMRAVCDECGQPVAIAGQSSHRLRTALDDQKHKRTTLRLPQELEDFIALELSRAGAHPGHEELYFRALLLACHRQEKKVGGLLKRVKDPVLDRPRTATVTLRISPKLMQVVDNLRNHSGVQNLSELLRRLLVLADTEGLSPSVQAETARLAIAYA